MALWIPITLAAAFFQNLRSAAQVRLRGRVGAAGAAYVRFLYAAPFAAGFAAVAVAIDGATPGPTVDFALWLSIGAGAQIMATVALLAAAAGAGFAVSAAASKTEPILAALAGLVLLAEAPPALGWLGIALGVCGVWLAGAPLSATAPRRALALGVASAALFGLSAVAYRGATLGLDGGSAAARAGVALAAATALQTVAMGGWLALFRPAELRATLAAWRSGVLVGLAGAAASAGWFTAMTLEPAAHVRALAQVELAFAAATAWLWFGERPGARTLFGLALVGIGAAALLLAVT